MNKNVKLGPRLVVQIFFFLLLFSISLNKYLIEMGNKGFVLLSSASLHGLCPLGGVVSIYQFATVGTFVQKIHQSAFILMIIVFILAFLFGPVFCGWVCPLGSIQEWVGKIGRKILGNKYNSCIPHKIDNYLRYLRYIILIWVLYAIGSTGKLLFQEYDPYFALFNFWTSEVALTALLILGVVLLASFFVERPWCKYACPYGAVLGITNFFRIFKIKRDTASCIKCENCDRACPMNIAVSKKDNIRNHQCITCMRCTSHESCPINNTVELAVKGGLGI